jgi:16S rRNA (cytosine967-C5)-methyltransferase
VVRKPKKNPRAIALEILYDIEVKDAFANQAVQSLSTDLHLSSLDRRFISQLVFGATKMRRRLDYVLGLFLERKIDELTPWIRNVLRMGIYQMDFLTKVPPSAAVDESVKLAKTFGHKGTVALVNAVLRSYLRDRTRVVFPSWEEDRVENIALFYSFPSWMIAEWLKALGEEATIKLCQAFNGRPRLSCRINPLKIDPTGLEETFRREKVKFRQGRFLQEFYQIESKVDLNRFASLQKGWVYFQDESAGLPVRLLDPQPGEHIVDLCAAPGGKSTFTAERMKDQGVVLAVDVSEARLKTVQENCLRLGVHSVVPCCADAREFLCRTADRVLVDAPCSALGTLGRNSDARWRKQKEDVVRLKQLQLEILLNAARLLKEGGVLVYSTCTLMPEENEGVIERFLRERRDFKLADPSSYLDPAVVAPDGTVRTFPHLHQVDGSFACRLERTSSD